MKVIMIVSSSGKQQQQQQQQNVERKLWQMKKKTLGIACFEFNIWSNIRIQNSDIQGFKQACEFQC